jgi:DNA polymerase-3 subunit epsilon
MKLVFLDIETTGIPSPASGLIQIAGTIEIDGSVKEVFNFRIRPFPEDVVTDEALTVNGASRAELAVYDDPARVFEQFVALLGKYVDRYDRSDKFHFVAYNARFDADHLRAWFEKCGDRYFGSWFWHPVIDVMGLAAVVLMRERAEIGDYKLVTVAEVMGLHVDEDAVHDAMYDAEITRHLFHWLLEQMDKGVITPARRSTD